MGHTLADEMGAFAIELPRVRYLLVRVLDAIAPAPHPNLSPHCILIDDEPDEDEDHVTLVAGQPLPAYTAPERQTTFASNIYALGAILNEWIYDRRDRTPAIGQLVSICLDPDATRRPALADVRRILTQFMPAPERGVWRSAFVTSDPQEQSLIDTLRANPRDTATRSVYADWLEQHGHVDRAHYLRLEDSADVDEAQLRTHAPPVDEPWRAIVGRPKLEGCERDGCPGRWDQLARTRWDNVRTCASCEHAVFLCSSAAAARAYGRRGSPMAVDASADHAAIAAARVPRLLDIRQIMTNPPPPRVDDDRPSVLTRFFGLFRRR